MPSRFWGALKNAECAQRPCFEMTVASRDADVTRAARRVTASAGLDEEADEEEMGRCVGARAEHPVGAAGVAPKSLLCPIAHLHHCAAQVHARQGYDDLKDPDPQVARGDVMSNIILWLSCGMVAVLLLQVAVKT